MRTLAATVDWDHARWPHFTSFELACKCNRYCFREYWHDPDFLDRLQALRFAMNRPLRINSAHRCDLHNAAVGGAALSMHKTIAADISIRGYDADRRKRLLAQARRIGFTGFGFYRTFLHLDLGRPRHWFMGQGGRKTWQSLI